MSHATIAPARRARSRRPAHQHRPAPVRPSLAAPPRWTVMPLWQALATDVAHP
ncbi:hypothetical protein ACIBVL_12210 [Streptomyces sp. NPDC049687]|uniref:hypothetical protein n=1 Tax=Streptomyces sp. NPDC049687 TaxID=3365596 RepID=UPI0037A2F922